MKNKTPKRSNMQERNKCYENIILLFSEDPEGLTTREVYTALADQFGFSKKIKTVENYLKDLEKEVIPGIKFTWIKNQKHQLTDLRELSTHALKQHIDKLGSQEIIHAEEKAYMRLAMESIRKLDTLSSRHHKDIEQRLGIRGLEESPYFIDNDDMESIDMLDGDILGLKEAIVKDAITEFRYEGKSRKNIYVVEPYKLIIFDGLWYLFGKDLQDKGNPFKTWRLCYIKNVDYDLKAKPHQMKDEDAERILEAAEDANFIVDTSQKMPRVHKNILVRLRIDPSIMDVFHYKAHIPGDVSAPEEGPDGFYTLCTKVNSFNDIKAEIKAWIPYIEILEPASYREELFMEIETYRQQHKTEIKRLKKTRKSTLT